MTDRPDDSFSVRLNQAVNQQDADAGPDLDVGAPSDGRATPPGARSGDGADSFSVRLESLGSTPPAGATPPTAPPDEEPATAPCGTGTRIVARSECIAAIARDTGHAWQTIWDDAGNADIREARQDPNLLLEGDRLHVPPIEAKQEPAETETRHRFVLSSAPAQLVLQLKDAEGRPRANVAWRLEGAGPAREGFTDPTGTLRTTVPAEAREAVLTLTETGESYRLRLGALQTAPAIAGVQARLNNLGFNCGPVTGTWNEQTRTALRLFQQREGLPAHGQLDEQTLHRLRNVHRS